MNPAFVVRFRPLGPWRIGHAGARDRVDRVFHSDALFSALSAAMLRTGRLEEWLDATVRSPEGARVALSSCFPYLEEVHFVPPPRTMWPPPASAKVRWSNACFVPLAAAQDLVAGRSLSEDAWYVDGPSGCLLPEDARFHSGPFRMVTRSHAAVDRLRTGVIDVHRTACLEFAPRAGLWAAVRFADEAAREQWLKPVQGALRLLADTGLGGERSLGWGRSEEPEFFEGALPDLILGSARPQPANGDDPVETAYWLLSLFNPSPEDAVDWRRGGYSLVTRGGRVESPSGSGDSKKLVRMVEEGSVLAAARDPRGSAPDVAPEGFAHPVYRAGFAVAIPIPLRAERMAGSVL
jgi:CRISPR type III-A-associated RAMP protein Csm4